MAKSGQSSKSSDCIYLIISAIRLGNVLDIVKVLKFALLRYDTFPPGLARALAPQTPLAALAISYPGESAGFFRENGSLSPGVESSVEVQQGLLGEVLSIQAL